MRWAAAALLLLCSHVQLANTQSDCGDVNTYFYSLTSGACEKQYYSGELETKDTVLYGRFEASIRAVDCPGVISTFFIYKKDRSDGTWGEIDVELFGKEPAAFQSNLITGPAGGRRLAEMRHTVDPPFDKAFHTFVMEWTPTAVRWFVNDVQVRPAANNPAAIKTNDANYVNTLTSPMTLFLNMWAANNQNAGVQNWAGQFPAYAGGAQAVATRCGLPFTVEYEYVRYSSWQGLDAEGKDIFQPQWADEFDQAAGLDEYNPFLGLNEGRWRVSTAPYDISIAQYSRRGLRLQNGNLQIIFDRKEEAQNAPQGIVNWCFEDLPTGQYTTNPVTDLRVVAGVGSLAACQQLCVGEALCSSVNFVSSTQQCRLEYWPQDIAKIDDNPAFAMGGIGVTRRQFVTASLKRGCEWLECKANGVVQANDVGHLDHIATRKECAEQCQANGQCYYIVHNAVTEECFLKGYLRTGPPVYNMGLVSQPPTCDKGCAHFGIVYGNANGQTVETFQGDQRELDGNDWRQCDALCTQQGGGCVSYTWIQPRCVLQRRTAYGGTEPLGERGLEGADANAMEAECAALCAASAECSGHTVQRAVCQLKQSAYNGQFVFGFYSDNVVQYVSGPAFCPDRNSGGLANAQDSQGCPEGWRRAGDKCYLVNFEELAWPQAADACTAYEGASLAMPKTQQEDAALLSLFCSDPQNAASCSVPRGKGSDGAYFIGLQTKVDADGVPHSYWVDGSEQGVGQQQYVNFDDNNTPRPFMTPQGETLPLSCAFFYPRDANGAPTGVWGREVCGGRKVDDKLVDVKRRYICERYADGITPPPVEKAELPCGALIFTATSANAVQTVPDVADTAACQAACAADPQCFSVNLASDMQCYLAGWNVAGYTRNVQMTSLPRSCDMTCADAGFVYGLPPAESVDTFTGAQEQLPPDGPQTAATCAQRCAQRGDCTTYTWIQPRCVMRRQTSAGGVEDFGELGLSADLSAAERLSDCEALCEDHPECSESLVLTAACQFRQYDPASTNITLPVQKVFGFYSDNVVQYASGPAACPERRSSAVFDPADSLGCPEGYLRAGARCYRLGLETLSYGEAVDMCRTEGGKLAMPKSPEENAALLSLFCKSDLPGSCVVPRGRGADGAYFIGVQVFAGVAGQGESVFWGDGVEASYSNFFNANDMPFQPAATAAPVASSCGTFWPRDNQGRPSGAWGRDHCDPVQVAGAAEPLVVRRRYICQRTAEGETDDSGGGTIRDLDLCVAPGWETQADDVRQAEGAATLDDCQKACSADPQCYSALFLTASSGCYLKGWRVTGMLPNSGAVSLRRSCDHTCMDEGFVYGVGRGEDVDLFAGDAVQVQGGPDQCQPICDQRGPAACRVWTWVQPRCGLFRAAGNAVLSEAGLVAMDPASGQPRTAEELQADCTALCANDEECGGEAVVLPAVCQLRTSRYPVQRVNGYYSANLVRYVSGPAACPARSSADVYDPQAAVGCPEGWVRSGERCYRVSYQADTWTNAKAACEADGSTLAAPRSAQENRWLLGVFCSDPADPSSCSVPRGGDADAMYFIGVATLSGSQESFLADGTPAPFNNFATPPAVPAPSQPLEQLATVCAAFVARAADGTPSGLWANEACDQVAGRVTVRRRYVCERPSDGTTVAPPTDDSADPRKCHAPFMQVSASGLRAVDEVANVEACEQECAQDQQCYYASFLGATRQCFLQGWDRAGLVKKTAFVATLRSCDTSCSDRGFVFGAATGTEDPSMFAGPSVPLPLAGPQTADQCQPLCDAATDTKCAAWTWVQPRCLLKSADGATLFERGIDALLSAEDRAAACDAMCKATVECVSSEAAAGVCQLKASAWPVHRLFGYHADAIVQVASGPAACPGRSSTTVYVPGEGEGCKEGFRRAGDRCYSVSFERATFTEAQDICRGQGAYLAMPKTRAENDALMSLFCQGTGPAASCSIPRGGLLDGVYWLGLQVQWPGLSSWADGSEASFLNLDSSVPLQPYTAQSNMPRMCAYLYPRTEEGLPSGGWGLEVCDPVCRADGSPTCAGPDWVAEDYAFVRRRYICEALPVGVTTQPPPTITPPVGPTAAPTTAAPTTAAPVDTATGKATTRRPATTTTRRPATTAPDSGRVAAVRLLEYSYAEVSKDQAKFAALRTEVLGKVAESLKVPAGDVFFLAAFEGSLVILFSVKSLTRTQTLDRWAKVLADNTSPIRTAYKVDPQAASYDAAAANQPDTTAAPGETECSLANPELCDNTPTDAPSDGGDGGSKQEEDKPSTGKDTKPKEQQSALTAPASSDLPVPVWVIVVAAIGGVVLVVATVVTCATMYRRALVKRNAALAARHGSTLRRPSTTQHFHSTQPRRLSNPNNPNNLPGGLGGTMGSAMTPGRVV